MQFRDKQTLFKAMRNLDMRPENQVWASSNEVCALYNSIFGKIISGLGATASGKVLTGVAGKINVFFIEVNGALIPYAESFTLNQEEIAKQGKQVIEAIQREYLKCAMEKLQKSIVMTGQSTTLTSDSTGGIITHTLEIGSGKRFVVSINQDGLVNETVAGIIGKSCVDISKMVESLMTESVSREWTVEYSEVLEDQVVQVLNLR